MSHAQDIEETNAAAPAQPESQPARPKPTKSQIAGLVTELANDDYTTRLKAKAALLDFGIGHPVHILENLADPYFITTDAEVHLQLRMIIWNILRFDLNERPVGFVGIQMHDATIFKEQGKAIRTVQVMDVIHGTAADKNGIRFGDHIVEFNGKPFTVGFPSQEFQKSIQLLAVGDTVKLLINRDNKDIEMEFSLGERPLNLIGTNDPEKERLKTRFDAFILEEGRKRGLEPDVSNESPVPTVSPRPDE
jgi:C-terminal processing protease CtpA/Prc